MGDDSRDTANCVSHVQMGTRVSLRVRLPIEVFHIYLKGPNKINIIFYKTARVRYE